MDEAIRELQKKCEGFSSFVATQKERNLHVDDRLDKVEDSHKILTGLSSALSGIEATLVNQGDDIKEMKSTVKEIKDVPAKRWDYLILMVIGAVVGAAAKGLM